MRFFTVVRLLALPCLWMGLVQLIFGVLAWIVFDDRVTARYFFWPALLIISGASGVFWVLKRMAFNAVSIPEAMLFASLTWVVVGLLGAIPIIEVTGISFTDGFFESVSALTTTGATVLSGLDVLPASFLLYRQFLQWMGGLGVVIFVVAVLPMLNIGGMRLLKAETAGPIKGDKISPRVANTTHYLWLVYVSITLLCAVAYWLAGMSGFDAIAHSFTTVSTGGFSTYDASMGHFQSPLILWIANIFMLLGAISFSLHYRIYKTRRPLLYWQDEETRVFLLLVILISSLLAVFLWYKSLYPSFFESVTQATFHIISFMTSTGYGAGNFGEWSEAAVLLLIMVGYIGGCAGSTAGGNKVIRGVISFKVIVLEIKKLVHPSGVFTMKFQLRPVNDDIRNAVMAFVYIVFVMTFLFTFLLMLTGVDLLTAFSATAACLNVLGPGFGDVGSNFAPLNDVATWLLIVAMILGRLEYFTVIVLFFPLLWNR